MLPTASMARLTLNIVTTLSHGITELNTHVGAATKNALELHLMWVL